MSRVFGQVYCSIWEDPEFIALSAGAQRTYLFLMTQPEITACGSLPLTLRRWSQKSADCADGLTGWLNELVRNGFVSVDDETEELFVRTFAKYDRGYLHTVRRKAVISTARAIRSASLRSTAVDELGKLGLSIDDAVPIRSLSSATAPPLSGTTEPVESIRIQGYVGGEQLDPESLILERGDVATAVDDMIPPPPFCPQHMPRGTTEPCGACGTAKRMLDAWHERDAARRAAEIEARRTAVLACRRCDDQGWTDDEDGNPTVRCDHTQLALIVGLGGV